MKPVPISKHSAFDQDLVVAAIADAPDQLNDSACPYDPNDAAAVAAFWGKGKVRLPGQRGPQKQATKVAVTIRYSPEIVAYFRSTGEGWQTRMNEVLLAYVEQQSKQ